MMADRKMPLNELARRIGITDSNLSILKTGKAKAIRLSTLEALCRELGCQPGELLEYEPGGAASAAAEADKAEGEGGEAEGEDGDDA